MDTKNLLEGEGPNMLVKLIYGGKINWNRNIPLKRMIPGETILLLENESG